MPHRFVLLMLAAFLLTLTGCADDPNSDPDPRPNILIIMSDDQRYDLMEYMPLTRSLIFDQGITFDHAYVTTPQCCPSRSSILTGKYAHNHGVLTNTMPLNKPTLVQSLHENGYYTGLVGKYLNSYPKASNDDGPLPEFDSWVALDSGPHDARYFDPVLSVSTGWLEHEGYMTYILRDYALDFLDQAAEQDKPFFLMFTPYAPHLPAEPAPEDTGLFPNPSPYRPPSFNEEDVSDKPAWLADMPLMPEAKIEDVDMRYWQQARTLAALDRSIETIMQKLEEKDMLDNTIVIYLSDNGHASGEHRVGGGKMYVYEELIHVPLAIRYPPLITTSRIDSTLVANIDLAPTLYELAGIPIPADVDGLSLLPLLRGQTLERDKLIIEAWPKPNRDSPPYLAVRTERYLYVETEGDRFELYDMDKDPFQLENQIDNPEYADVIAELHTYLEEARASIPPLTPVYASDEEDE
jgi:N-acetylglucosamine-6-sulfatase